VLTPVIELVIRWRLADINWKNGDRLRWLHRQLAKEWAQKEQ